jgi:hypothetical protein
MRVDAIGAKGRGWKMSGKPKRITQQPKAWREGFGAGRRFVAPKRQTCNPYPPDSDEASDWIEGFIQGKTQPIRAATDKQ